MSVEASGSEAAKTQLALLGFSKAGHPRLRTFLGSMQSINAAQDSVQKQPKAASGDCCENKRTALQPALRIEVQKMMNDGKYEGRTLKFGPHHFMLLRNVHTKECMYSYKHILHIARLDKQRICIELSNANDCGVIELKASQADEIIQEFMARCPYFCFSPFVAVPEVGLWAMDTLLPTTLSAFPPLARPTSKEPSSPHAEAVGSTLAWCQLSCLGAS